LFSQQCITAWAFYILILIIKKPFWDFFLPKKVYKFLKRFQLMDLLKLTTISFNLIFNPLDFIVIYPEIFMINATFVLLIYGVIMTTTSTYHNPLIIRNISMLAIYVLIFTGLLLSFNPITNGLIFRNIFVIDNFVFFFKIFVLLSTVCALLLKFDFYKQENLNQFESIILVLLATSSMLFLIASHDLIIMYLSVELQALAFYILAASKRNSEFSTEAGLKYFILGAFSSGILLFGCSMLYGFTGLTNFSGLAKFFVGFNLMDSNQFLFGILFIAVGFLFKLTAFPFHIWVPDVYEGAPTSVTSYFSIVPKIAVFAIFTKLFLFVFFEIFDSWQPIFVYCSAGSMILGSIAAIFQKKIKRLLAFSSIGHMGYLLIGVCCGTLDGIMSTIVYLMIYTLMIINIFASILALKSEDNSFRIKYIEDFGLLSKSNPLLAINMTLVLFSMAGIPPLAGFCSKFYIFFIAIKSSHYFLSIIGILASVISCYFYIRFIKIIYFDKPKKWAVFQSMDREKSLLLSISLLIIIFFFCYPSLLFILAHKAAITFCF